MKLVRVKEGYRKVGDKYLLAKKCTKCGRWLVASTDNFYKHDTGKYGLKAQCKECRNKKIKQWREANKDKIFEQQKQYRENNKDKMRESTKRWYQANRDKKLEYNKQWNKDNRDKTFEHWKRYRQSPQGQVTQFNGRQRRRAKEEQLGTGITKDQWLEMMKFFDWKCAYSGETLTKDTGSVDHIVPLNSNGDNMIWNMVPMTRSLNSSKQDKDMLEWYREQDCYSEARLAKIYEWQEYARKKWKK